MISPLGSFKTFVKSHLEENEQRKKLCEKLDSWVEESSKDALTRRNVQKIILACFDEKHKLLDFNFFRVGSLPECFGYLHTLEELRLGGNLLKELPFSIRHLPNLKFLDLQNNVLSSIPDQLLFLSSACKVDMSLNSFLPDDIAGLKKAMKDPNYKGPCFNF